MIEFLINLIILVILLVVLFKIVDIVLSYLGVTFDGRLKQLVLLLLFLIIFAQVLGLAGAGVPHYRFYHPVVL